MKRLLSILFLVCLYPYHIYAQSFPTKEEMRQVLTGGLDWQVVRMKERILNIQSAIDSTSVDYQICNFALLPLYEKLADSKCAKKVSETLYHFLKSGGRSLLKDRFDKEQLNIDELQMQIALVLMSCYADEENYIKAQMLGEEILRYAKEELGTRHYYAALAKVAYVQNKLGDNISAYRNIKLCYNKFDNSESFFRNTTRTSINTTYFNVLRDLSKIATSTGNIRSVRKYFHEAMKIVKDYSETDTAIYFDSEFLIDVVESFSPKMSDGEISRSLLNVVEAKRRAYLDCIKKFDLEDCALNDNDYYADCFLCLAQDAMAKNKQRAIKVFITIAAELCRHSDVSSTINEFTLDWLAYYFARFKGDYLSAMKTYEQLIPIRRNNNNVKDTYTNILSAVECATLCNRYFYSIAIGSLDKQGETDYIPVFVPQEMQRVLVEWEKISKDIIANYGISYFNTLLASFDTSVRNSIFVPYSLPDTKLMMAHNFIRSANYDAAFTIIQELISEESLNNDNIKDLIWDIDDNLYLNTGYVEAEHFLKQVKNANFIKANPDLAEWVDYESRRITDWLGYAMGYAHGLSEEGKSDEAMREYDIIIKQIQRLEKRDSLYLEVQMTRAIDLYSIGNDKAALEVAMEVNKLSKAQKPQNELLRSNALWLIGECLRKEERYADALAFCEENISLLKKVSVNNDSHHLQNVILQRGDILLALKRYDASEDSYLEYLKESVDNSSHITVICGLAQIYNEELKVAIQNKDGKQCLALYFRAIDLFTSYPKAAFDGYCIYFHPLNERIRINDIVALIPHDTISLFCDKIIALDQIVANADVEEGCKRAVDPIEKHAHVIGYMARICSQNKYYEQSLSYYNKAIEYVIQNRQVTWGNFLAQLYSFRAHAKQDAGEWVPSIQDRILAFKSSIDSNGRYAEASKEYFAQIKTAVSLSTATSARYSLSAYSDSMHPHLSYAENLEILQMWRACLNEVVKDYGNDYLMLLHNYEDKNKEESYLNQFGSPRPYSVSDKLSYLTETYYTEALIDIMHNHLDDFTISCKKLFDEFIPFNDDEDVNELRYNVVTELSDALSYAGCTNQALGLLGSYYQYLVEHTDFELAEKVTTLIGFDAWQIMDLDRLIWATRTADFVSNEGGDSAVLMFNDINELILQLVLLSRTQQICNNPNKAKSTLEFAKTLIDNNTHLRSGLSVTTLTTTIFYNDLAMQSDDSTSGISYYQKALDNESEFDFTTSINMATQYTQIGKFQESDSLLCEVYQFSKKQYVEPKWKAAMYRALTSNAIKKKEYDKAQVYSQEGLSIQISDYLKTSQFLTSQERDGYLNRDYAQTLCDASSTDLACGINGSNAYNAALFQKDILIRQKRTIKENILKSSDLKLKEVFTKFNQEVRSNSDSAAAFEAYCMDLYSMHPEFVETFSIPQWQQVQSSLRRADLAIEFSEAYDDKTGEYYYVAIILRRDFDVPMIIRLCDEDALTTLAFKNCGNAGFSIALYQDATVLYHLIWEPLEKYLTGVKTIYYSPFEALNNINIEVARKKQGGKTVSDTYQLLRVSSTSELVARHATSCDSAILFGGIDYNATVSTVATHAATSENKYSKLRGSLGGTWHYLSNTRTEVEEIKMLLKRNNIPAELYISGQGTEGALKSLSGKAPDILHLATHGFYYTSQEASQLPFYNVTGNPSYNSSVSSGLVFAGANHVWNGESVTQGCEDGILTADEIIGMDLTGTSLLTLSACQTALGDIACDGIYGLQRSFKIAGVGTIVMSLWEVDDEATCMMMERFYRELVNGKEKHEAFRIAQSEIRIWAEKLVEDLKADFSNLPIEAQEKLKKQYGARLYPEYYWGAFVMLD